MHDLLLLAAFLVAIATGWWLGKRERKKRFSSRLALPEGYIDGLDFLIREQPDGTIEEFLNALGNQSDSIDVHLALGKLFRTRGEVDKATKVHQALLARSGLSGEKLQWIQFELANDYMVAGLLDRAERLLVDLSQVSGEVKWQSIEKLMLVYQHEKDWVRAIDAALALLPRKSAEIRPILAQYFCEKAALTMVKDEMSGARRELKRALSYDSNCVRASLLKGKLEAQTGHFKDAIKAFRRVKEQDTGFLSEIIPSLSECYRQLNKEKEFMAFLMDCLQQNPSATLVLASANLSRGNASQWGLLEQLIKKQLMTEPSLRGLLQLIDLKMTEGKYGNNDCLSELREMVVQLVEVKPAYRCSDCGYSGRRLVWLCPSCQQWGKIKPIYGLGGE